ncbi:hypothetical protein FACS189449_06610 [Alphaproteobacteria bacterium]|nr:hypothetical protein FACS189449_06610 [Alphaproteobacteria bacterium]
MIGVNVKYVCGLCSLFLLGGCGSYENDNIDTEEMKKTNRLLVPPVASRPSASIGKEHNEKQQSDKEAKHKVRLHDANEGI